MNRFRFYYEFAQKIILNEEEPPQDQEAPEEITDDTVAPPPEGLDLPQEETPAMPETGTEISPEGEIAAGDTPTDGTENKINKDVKDKIDDTIIIKKVDGKALVTLEEQIDSLSIKIIERKEKIETLKEALSFLDKIDDTKPNKYKKEEKYKKLNGLLLSEKYQNLSPSNLYSIHNALKENFKIIEKDFKNKKDNKGMSELRNIAKKAKRAKFSKNINSLNEKINNIKNSLNNINQIFGLKDFPKMQKNIQDEIKRAQKNSSDFLKKLS